MSVSDLREALLESIPEAPPTPYTALSLLASAARARRRRGVALTGASLATVGVVTAGMLAGLGLSQSDRAAGTATEPIGPVGRPAYELDPSLYCRVAEGFSGADPEQIKAMYWDYAEPFPSEDPVTVIARLSCYLMTVVPSYLPAAAFYVDTYRLPVESQWLAEGQPLRVNLDPQAGPPNDPNTPSFSAGAIVADGAGVGTIDVRASTAGSWSPQDMADHCLARPSRCELRTGPAGEVIGVWTTEGSSGYRLVHVEVHLSDTIVMGTATNIDPSAQPGHPDARRVDGAYVLGRDEPPLSADDLIAILASPQFALR